MVLLTLAGAVTLTGGDVYYKWLNEDGTTPQQGAQWKLPRGNKPGAWMPPVKGDLVECKNGYHIVSETQLIDWLAHTLWECEPRGDVVDWGNKSGCRSARLLRRVDTWNDRTARLFACDYAERALEIVDNPDLRSVEAVRVARQFARGKATREQLAAAWAAAWAAAGDAAWAAAWAAARDAAGAAARSAAWAAAWDAAWDAAGAAARSAAWAAAWDAAWDAERQWQNSRLLEYIRGERS